MAAKRLKMVDDTEYEADNAKRVIEGGIPHVTGIGTHFGAPIVGYLFFDISLPRRISI